MRRIFYTTTTWRGVRVVDRTALEKPCPARDRGFESLPLRQVLHSTKLKGVAGALEVGFGDLAK